MTANTQPAIEINDLTIPFGPFTALNQVSLTVRAGAGVYAAAPAAAGVSRRADRRRRSGGPPRVVGLVVPPGRGGHHARGHDALHGRGGALRPGRLSVPVETAGAGHAGRVEAVAA